MRDGTIGLDEARGLWGWAMKRITGKAVGHSKQYIWGFTWERTMWWAGWWFKSGIRITLGYAPSDYYGQPRAELSGAQVKAMLSYYLEELNRRRPYNWPKLIALAVIIPLRPYLERLGLRLYENANLGDVCSPTTDEACRAAGWDVLPGHDEGSTAPGDFLDSTEFDWTTERPT